MKHEALAPEDLWDAIEPFLPEEPLQAQGWPDPRPGPRRLLRHRLYDLVLSLLAPPAYGVKSRS
jgi:hypothetical protein